MNTLRHFGFWGLFLSLTVAPGVWSAEPPVLSVGNLVWNDLNNNGVRDAGEAGMAGVGVSLYADDGDGIGADDGDGIPNTGGDHGVMWTTTDIDGLYQFTGIEPGNYFIRIEYGSFAPGQPLFGFVSSTGVADPDDDPDDNDDNGIDEAFPLHHAVHSPVFTVAEGSGPTNDGDDANGNQAVDFGFHAPAHGPVLTLGGLVWRDDGAGAGGVAGDGVRQPGEPGLAGVPLNLYQDDGNGLRDGLDQHVSGGGTDGTGEYRFPGLPPGTYFVEVNNWSFSADGPLFGLVSSPGSHAPNDDSDNDDSGVDDLLAVAHGLSSGPLTLSPAGEPDTDVDGDGTDSNLTLDFGFYSPPNPPVLALGGVVWQDDGDGVREAGEAGIPNVAVALIRDGGDGQPNTGDDQWMFHAYTDAQGRYRATGLPAGDYFTRVENWNFQAGSPLHGRLSAPGNVAANDNQPNDDTGIDDPFPVSRSIMGTMVSLAHGTEPDVVDDGDGTDSNQTVDFGFFAPASDPPVLALGGVVWRDDGDGVREAGEAGIPNVAVAIIRDGGDGQPNTGDDHWFFHAWTDAQGRYLATGLPPGDYFARVDNWNFAPGAALAGLFSAPGATDPNDDIVGDDSGVDVVQPENQSVATRLITLTNEQEPDTPVDGDGKNGNLSLDFAFMELAGGPNLSVGGTVFADVGNSGTLDGGETGVEGVGLELWIDNGDGMLGAGDNWAGGTGTDGGGDYRFDGLVPADYFVVVSRGNFINGPLVGYATSTGNDPAPDPDNNVDDDDNGADVSAFGPAFYGVGTGTVSLRPNDEPTTDGDGDNSNLTVDFGFVPGAAMTLGGTVFRDGNNSGLFEPAEPQNEPGVAGVVVELWIDANRDGRWSEGDGWAAQVETDAQGAWSFRVPPGDDYLAVITYRNFMPGRSLNGLRSSTGNGVAPDPDDGVDRDDNGEEYAGFSRLFVGVASLPITLTPGTEPTDDGDTDPNTNFSLDFGFYPGPTQSIGDLVFLDANNNGVQDGGEAGLPNVRVKLLFDNGDGVLGDGDEDLGVDVYTDASGVYSLAGLPEGDYLVVLLSENWGPGRALNGLRSSRSNDSPEPAPDPDTDATDNDDNGAERIVSFWPSLQVATKAFRVQAGTDFSQHVDFGFYPGPTLSVGGLVFRDENNSGVLDPGETGIGNVEVNLFMDTGDGTMNDADWHLGAVRTDATGNYRFTGLAPGNYNVFINYWEHFYGRALTGLRTSKPGGSDAVEDPDDDATVGDDNGFEVSGWGLPVAGTGTRSITLGFGAEPPAGVDGDDTDSNATVDLGFRPVAGTSFVVTTADDHDDGACDGDCTLREAINAANASAGADTIAFNIDSGDVHTLQPTSPLPAVIEPVVLDGLTQPGASCGSWPPTLLIELDGSLSGGSHGLVLQGGYSTIRGLVINRFGGEGIHVEAGGHNHIACNLIGTDPAGTLARGNGQAGIGITSDHNTIGGVALSERNLTSANYTGVSLGGEAATANEVIGNYIGADVTGSAPLGNTWMNVHVAGSPNNLLAGNVVSASANAGFYLEGTTASGNRLQGNRIGTTASGTTALPNNNSGVYIRGGAHGNTVGGTGAGEGNLISGNGWYGVEFQNAGTTDNLVLGNYIGTDITGTLALGNHAGISINDNADANQIGSAEAGGRNVISGNRTEGILLQNAGPNPNRILGNSIGTAQNGVDPLPNQGSGVAVLDTSNASLTVIGGTAGGEGNTIAHNVLWGVFLPDDGPTITTVRGNSIYSNSLLGIELLPTPGSAWGPTPNDALDADTGANGLQNFPELTLISASAAYTVVDGVLNSAPNATFTLDFYASAACDNSGFGEGQVYLGSTTVTTDAAGTAYFVASLPTVSVVGHVATATATDADGNTSEFSACRPIGAEAGPTLVAVHTGGTYDRIELTFNESVDPASATVLGNYALSDGGAVLSVTLGGDPRTVILGTTPMAAGTDYTLTVNGVTDRAVPPNPCTANLQATVFQTLGHLARRQYQSIPGSYVADLVNHARFPRQPTVLNYPTEAESPSHLGNYYGVQLLGYIHPPVTGDYVFYLAADERAELWLSTSENPAGRVLIASESMPNEPRQWTGGRRSVSATFPAGTRFIEAEDFDYGGGQWVVGTPIGMDGPYTGGSYAGLGTAADLDIDWHEQSPDNSNPTYRPDTGVETWQPAYPSTARAGFDVSVCWTVGWNDVGDWRNYTRDFGASQDYQVYARVASGGSDIVAQLDEVTAGVGTSSQTTVKLGTFQAPATGDWNIFTFVPLRDDAGNPVALSLGGLKTLRFTLTGGNGDPDYLAFVPVGAAAPVLQPANISAAIPLIAGQKYYLEALHKEASGVDHLAVAWQLPGAPTPANGSDPIPSQYLEAIVDPNLVLTAPPTMSIGNLVFSDNNRNGVFEPTLGETGIDGVAVQVWRDEQANNWLEPASDTLLATTTTQNGGYYRFDGLLTDTYLVVIPGGNFEAGGPLAFRPSSDVNSWANWDVDNDDDGVPRGELLGVVCNGALWLEDGREPTHDGDNDPWTNLTVDFGFIPAAAPPAIGNLVFRDLDGDGQFNPGAGETGISDVAIDLYRDDDANGYRSVGDTFVVRTTTDANGGYVFADLPQGRYIVEVAALNFAPTAALAGLVPTPVASSNPNDGLDHDSNGFAFGGFSVAAYPAVLEVGNQPMGEDGDPNTNLTVDFGFASPTGLVLGDLVWHDTNGNGQREAGEPGIAGANLLLVQDQGDGQLDGGEAQLARAITDAEGRYLFTGLGAGTYFVRFDSWLFQPGQPLFGLFSSPGVAEGDTNVDDDDNGVDAPVPVAWGVNSTAITLAAGAEPENDGDGKDGNRTLDFGFMPSAAPPVLSFGNRVWLDDGDGVQEVGEPGIAGVGLYITRDGGDGVPSGDDQGLFHVWTDADGRYAVTGLPPGGYWARVESWNFSPGAPLFGLMSSPGAGAPNSDNDQDDNGEDSAAPVAWSVQSGLLELAYGGEPADDGDDANGNQTLDFGFYAPPNPPVLSVGGTVFKDTNGNGLRDTGEPGEPLVPGVGMALYWVQPDGSEWSLLGGGTDAEGNYRFGGLPAGTYRVVVWNWNFNPGAPLEGMFSCPGAADPDTNVKGDDNGSDAVSPVSQNLSSRAITLTHGAEPDEVADGDDTDGNQTLDFGFIELPGGPVLTLGGTVFRDFENDGLLDAADAGIPNAFVALWIDNGDGTFGGGDTHVGSFPATDLSGEYRFDNLPPADYFLQLYGEQFRQGAPLAGLRSSLSHQSPEPIVDPDDGNDGDDNGFETAIPGNPFMVLTAPVSLRSGGQNPNLTVDFGFYEGPTLELAGTVFSDANSNGQQDSDETGIASAWVEVWLDSNQDGVPSDGDSQLFGTATDAEGVYRFVGLTPADYLVMLRYYNFLPGRPLNGLRSSLSDRSPEPAADPNEDADGDDDGFEFGGWGRDFVGVGTRRITLAYNREPDVAEDGDGPNSNATVDFGFYAGPTASVGNQVFLDATNNGVRDGGDTGIADVHVKLFFDNGDGVLGDGDEDLGVDVSTDANGLYSLPGLPEGNYLVVLPYDNWWPGRTLNGLRSSLSNQSPEPAVDPDAVPTDSDDNGHERTLSWWPSVQVASRAFTVLPGDNRPDLDFGFYAGPTLSVAGTVFRDEDNSGTQAPGDAGVPGVVVQLFLDNGDGLLHHGDWQMGDTVTDNDGVYRFSGLMPGDYAVAIRRDNHFYGRALTNLRTSTGNDDLTGRAPDPDDDLEGDDNGSEVTAFDDPNFGVASLPVTLGFGAEPDAPIDGDDADSNATVDFGFRPVVGRTFVVNSTGDHDDGSCDEEEGDCTLREALNAANANPGTDTIRFNIGGGGPQTIQVGSALPVAIEPVVLDATTQLGYSETPLIELSGPGAGSGFAGLVLQGGHSTVRGFVINRFDFGGIFLEGAPQNVIQGNFIGTDPSGTTATGGTTSEHGGIYLSGSNDNQIGGTTATTRNLVSGGNVGIRCSNSQRNVIEGNYVGTDLTGTKAVGNYGRAGIWVTGGGQNRVGGTAVGAGNLVSGNNGAVNPWEGAGVIIEVSPGTDLLGNLIGTDITGTIALGNSLGLSFFSPGSTVGGVEAGSRNLISGNHYQGVNLGGECRFIGNLVGTDITGTRPLGNASVGVGLWGTANIVGGTTAAERNVISANQGEGIVICGSSGRTDNLIQGNYIGTDITGTVALGNGANGWGPGIRTCPDNNFNTIGGAAPGAGNLIAGNNGHQVDLRSSDNVVQGNRIGTDATGTVALLPASGGVGLHETAERNLIAGNLISGVDRAVSFGGSGVRANRVLGNRMGTDAAGTGPLPNHVGVEVADSPDNVIGGVAPGEGNTIAYSLAYGIGVSGNAALNNLIRGNSIHHNGNQPGEWLGIDLAYGPVVTPNDAGDPDEGPNHVQNYPVLLQAAASATALAVEGRLNSAPSTTFALDFYANTACDPTGYGEGKQYLGFVEVTTDANGDAYFLVNLPLAVAPGQFITATATDPAGNTSEFSACRESIAEGAPMILQAATRGTPNQVAVFFSETVDPTTATDAGNYGLSCAGVVSATMLDERTVLLTLDGPVSGPACTLTVNGVRDLADPVNTIATNTQADVFQAFGVITRREYWYVAGGQVWDLTWHPRFPNSPSVIDYPTLFESPSNLGENYGVQMLGYVHPPVSGEYVFYLSANETAELYLSSDASPANAQVIASEFGPNPPRQWTGGTRPMGAPPEEVLVAGTLFIEAEDFNYNSGQYVTDSPIGMTGPYTGGAYAVLGTAADADIDWHDAELDNPAAGSGYRANTGVECYTPGDRGDRMDRGTFEVTTSHSIGWQAVGDWQNYTRDFGTGGSYYVFARVASGGEPIAIQLDEVVGGASTTSQTTQELGKFQSPPTGSYDLYTLVPLTNGNGDVQTVSLAGVRTLRTTTIAGNNDFDYLAFLPVAGPPPQLRAANVSAPLHLEAGQRYYVEVRMKESGGEDNLGVAWQMPGGTVPANGDPPIPGTYLEAWIEPDVTPAPVLSLGGLVFKDLDNDGQFEPPTDTVVPGVTLHLWMDHNNDNALHHGDWLVTTTATDAQGRYRFEGLHAGNYIVAINRFELNYGRPLTGHRTSTDNDPAPDPDNDLVGEDNGYEDTFFDQPPGEWTASGGITLTVDGEPDAAVDGDGPDGNQTLDFGFRPVVGTTFIVNSTADPGDGVANEAETTLREAINAANANPGADTILFHIPNTDAGYDAATGVFVIRPIEALPPLNEDGTTIDGRSQAAFGGDSNPLGPEIRLEVPPWPANGLYLEANGHRVFGLNIDGHQGSAILVYGGDNWIASCYIGTDPTGSTVINGPHGLGIALAYGRAHNNIIGTNGDGVDDAAERNVIAGNFRGVEVAGVPLASWDTQAWSTGRPHGNWIAGNLIGVDRTGTVALGNGGNGGTGHGVMLNGATETLVGTNGDGISDALERNIISASEDSNVMIRNQQWDVSDWGGDRNVIAGNYIGTDITGTIALPRPDGPPCEGVELMMGTKFNRIEGNVISGHAMPPSSGLFVWSAGTDENMVRRNLIGTDASGSLALPNGNGITLDQTAGNVIGGWEANAGNVIAFNLNAGVFVNGELAVGNSIRGNSIHGNGSGGGGLGIDLIYGPMVTPNDPGDPDEGPNRVQNYPELLFASASPTSLMIEGRLNSRPGTAFALDFYANPHCASTTYGEGQTYLGFVEVTTDANGDVDFLVNLPVAVSPGQVITATATDPAGNTSEFSRCQSVVEEGPPTVVGAVTRGRPAYLEVGFSESLDPTTATDPNSYSLDCGVTVLAAAAGAEPRTVVLTLDGPLTPGCVLTINGVQDRALPPNPIAVNTTAVVLDSQGVITRNVYHGIGGSRVSDLTGDPRFPNAPDEVAYDTSFEAPANYADSFGLQMAGYLIPPVTGDYVFYLASDDSSDLFLSTDSAPANKQRIAWVTTWMNQRAWNTGLRWTPPEQVFGDQTLFIEAEDFNYGGGQWVAGADTGMNGAYSGTAYAGLSAVAEVDYHDPQGENPSGNDNPTPQYRAADQGVEITPYGGDADRSRGEFEVAVAYKVGWSSAGDWYNYTRPFPEPAREYSVYARLASGGNPIAVRLDEVTSGQTTPDQTTSLLGFFKGPPTGLSDTGGWDTFALIPLTDADGAIVTVNLGGTRTLRTTVTDTGDFDYLALVPAASPPEVRAENVSVPVHLVAGQKYYLEALSKDGGGSDHLAVTWRMPGAPPPANGDPPIPGAFLSSLQNSGPVVFTTQPLSQSIDERGSVTFAVELDGTPPYAIQWYRDGALLPGETRLTLTIPQVSGAAAGAQFQAVAANAFSSANSDIATLTVIPDIIAPTVTSVSGTASLTGVVVRFSEPLSPAAANAVAHYALSGNLTVLSAALQADQQTVRLTTTPQTAGVRYSLTLNGLLDLAYVPNPITPDTRVSFTAWTMARGFVLHEFWDNIYGDLNTLQSDPRYPVAPSFTESLALFEWPPYPNSDGSSNYGNRLSGWLLPPLTGDYRFYVCSDDPSAVFLSTDADPANKVQICAEPNWNNVRDYRTWDRRGVRDVGGVLWTENISDSIRLEANQRYYVEVLHTEGGGGDNVSLAWQLPGDPEVQSGDLPIGGQHVESMVNPDDWAPRLTELAPKWAPAGSGDTVVSVVGNRFTPDSVVLWAGEERTTSFVSPQELTATILATDLAIEKELTATLVTVRGVAGLASDPLAFTVAGALVQEAVSEVATSGETVVAVTVPTEPAQAGQPGVAAAVENAGAPDPVTITTGTYTENPTETTPTFDVGGGYVDVLVQGADPADVATSRFYYPNTVTGDAEANLMLLYFNGTAWVSVLSSGGVQPLKDTTDDLDGTVSGGRFTVTFDATSTPALTELQGTPFLLSLPNSNPPEAHDDLVIRRPGGDVKIPIASLLVNDSDPDGDPLTLTGFSPTARGVRLERMGAWLIYKLPAGFDGDDSFTYTITDGREGLASARVTIAKTEDDGASHNRLSATVAEGKTTLRFAGIPGRTYRVQRSPSLSPPAWTDLEPPVVCGPDGLMTFIDPEVTEPMRFYRTVAP